MVGVEKQGTHATSHAVSFQVGQDKKKQKNLKTVHVTGLQSSRKINSMWKDTPHSRKPQEVLVMTCKFLWMMNPTQSKLELA